MPTVRKTKVGRNKKTKSTMKGGNKPPKPPPSTPVTIKLQKYKVTNARTQGTNTDKLSTALRARHAWFTRVNNISKSKSNSGDRLRALEKLKQTYFTQNSNSNSKLKAKEVLRNNKLGKSLLQRMKNYALRKIAPQHLYSQKVYNGSTQPLKYVNEAIKALRNQQLPQTIKIVKTAMTAANEATQEQISSSVA